MSTRVIPYAFGECRAKGEGIQLVAPVAITRPAFIWAELRLLAPRVRACPNHAVLLVIIGLLISICLACERSSTGLPLKTQGNTALVFYGMAVDEAGKPLSGIKFEIRIESIPKDWTIEKRGQPHNYAYQTVVTGPDGRFGAEVSAHALAITPISPPGYRHLSNKFGQGDSGVYNLGYTINAWGDQWYRSDVGNPAIYVFVHDGVREISALPCRGGDQALGKRWIQNKPGWPPEPSLADVIYKQPGTKPS